MKYSHQKNSQTLIWSGLSNINLHETLGLEKLLDDILRISSTKYTLSNSVGQKTVPFLKKFHRKKQEVRKLHMKLNLTDIKQLEFMDLISNQVQTI